MTNLRKTNNVFKTDTRRAYGQSPPVFLDKSIQARGSIQYREYFSYHPSADYSFSSCSLGRNCHIRPYWMILSKLAQISLITKFETCTENYGSGAFLSTVLSMSDANKDKKSTLGERYVTPRFWPDLKFVLKSCQISI